MSVSHDSNKRALHAANDNSLGERSVSMNFPANPPISIVEVELFDRLISNLAELAANDDDEKPSSGE